MGVPEIPEAPPEIKRYTHRIPQIFTTGIENDRGMVEIQIKGDDLWFEIDGALFRRMYAEITPQEKRKK